KPQAASRKPSGPTITTTHEIKQMQLSKIIPADYNPREITPEARAGLQASLERFGLLDVLVVNKRTGRLVKGHQRLELLLASGVKRAPVLLVDFDEITERAANVSLNHQGLTGRFTEAVLPLIEELKAQMQGDALSLRIDELRKQIAAAEPAEPVDGLTDPDAVPEPPRKAITKPGDLWLLGEHRVLCGDSTKADDVERLMDGEKADFIFTDPPYGHNNNDGGDLIHNWEKALGKPETKSSAARPIANDSPEDAARLYTAFLKIANGLLRSGGCCCCCCGGGGPDPQFGRWSLEMDREIGFKMAVVWDKGGMGMGWHYRRNYEFVLIAEKPGGPCHWYGGHDVPNVIRDIGKIIPTADQHPTEKPVALPAFFIPLHSQAGEIVLDPFLGSGTTLIAAEQLGRRAYGIEIEPRYVDVCVRRWEEFTGKKAKRIGPDAVIPRI
ncbi:MAG: DNA modification methylase, partial [Planctomycetota bacterium]